MSATLACETAARKEAEDKASDVTERLAAAAEAKLDADIKISDLKTAVWDEQAKTEALQALSRPTVPNDAERQEASNR